MKSADYSTQEKLDNLLHDGKITDEDYLRLSKALDSGRKPAIGDAPQSAARRRLHKSWGNRQIGGVCGGIADCFDLDATIVRVIAVILLIIAPPMVLIAYIALSFLLPWDDERAANEPLRQGHPWIFAAAGALMITVAPWLFSQFLLPRLLDTYAQLGYELPGLAKFAVIVGDSYRYGMRWGSFAWGIWLSLGIVALSTLLYLVCHNQRMRLAFTVLFFLLCTLWVLIIAIGGYSGIWLLAEKTSY